MSTASMLSWREPVRAAIAARQSGLAKDFGNAYPPCAWRCTAIPPLTAIRTSAPCSGASRLLTKRFLSLCSQSMPSSVESLDRTQGVFASLSRPYTCVSVHLRDNPRPQEDRKGPNMSRIFGDIVQNGYVVRDIAAAMRHWIEVLGVGPWFYIERLPAPDFTYKGQPSPVDVSLALANSGPL